MRKQTDGATGAASPGTAASAALEVQAAVSLPTSGWDVHHPFGGFRDPGSALKEQGAPGLRFCTRLETAAVRFAW